jgi:carbamoyltransferase
MLPGMQSQLNLKIKFRESFRPFAPSVLAEKSHEYFKFDGDSPYMLFTAYLNENLINGGNKSDFISNEGSVSMLAALRQIKSLIPAATHVDFSARFQTVAKDDNILYYRLIEEFYKITGIPILVNTSFNVRGEPLVCSPKDAYACFMRTGMDVLVLENFILSKYNQPLYDQDNGWRNEYELD